ncbi:hypothetical protein [Leptothoe sp. PORK10 BA2]|uniref:hypothetical protein n=1 Tax=Leptothoe sp. PORK10 BA2 TaxID=3110254 RepID=UPI002B1F4AAB|nr:hypothetical protein [Leptothoe sp. PORK10 BA2]MEA5466038.1 hypothetical protein [Leptothoe sp. PORK10 BA2]
MTRRLEGIQEIIAQEKTRLETTMESLHEDIEAHIEFLENRVEKLQQTIAAQIEGYEMPGLFAAVELGRYPVHSTKLPASKIYSVCKEKYGSVEETNVSP